MKSRPPRQFFLDTALTSYAPANQIQHYNYFLESLQEVCHRYWPLGRGSRETFGKLLVTLKSQENCNDYLIRKMEITESRSRMSVGQAGFTVTQFQYLKWPEDGVPRSSTGVLELANLVQKVQMGSGNKPIVVMCK